jgi:hypothetical protein
MNNYRLTSTTAACAEAELLCRVLFPALMEAGAGKQNAVVVIVVRRYAGLVVVARLGSTAAAITFPQRPQPNVGAFQEAERTAPFIARRSKGLFYVAILRVKPDLLNNPTFV